MEKLDSKIGIKRKSMGDTRGNDNVLDFRSPNKINTNINLTRKSSKTNVINVNTNNINVKK